MFKINLKKKVFFKKSEKGMGFMLKNNKGVTLTILVISIIVMIIIFGITLSSADDLLRNSEKNRLKTNMYLIQSKAATL